VSTAQVSAAPRISLDVSTRDPDTFDVADTLRCLACGTVYPVAATSRASRFGCPACGNVTWIAAKLALPPEPEPLRSAGDPRRFRTG
jgi:predicted RNA-binding Zn-ribbon protein involved in translation (DUF1610 family)